MAFFEGIKMTGGMEMALILLTLVQLMLIEGK